MMKEIGIIKSEPLLLLALPFSVITFIFLLFLRPFVKINIGFIHCDRIGHFTPDIELYLCKIKFNKCKDKTVDLFYFPRKPCNKQLAIMCKREMNIFPWFFLRPLDLIFRTFNFLSGFRAYTDSGKVRDIDNLLDQLPINLKFTSEEEDRGRDGLIKLGINDNSPFVCLHVRDSAYLNNLYNSSTMADIHKYRNSDIQNYILGIKALVDRGYYVIRMGP